MRNIFSAARRLSATNAVCALVWAKAHRHKPPTAIWVIFSGTPSAAALASFAAPSPSAGYKILRSWIHSHCVNNMDCPAFICGAAGNNRFIDIPDIPISSPKVAGCANPVGAAGLHINGHTCLMWRLHGLASLIRRSAPDRWSSVIP